MAQTNPLSYLAANRVYEDFEPSYEWARDNISDTLIVMLKGFRRENLKVQIGTNRILKLRGEQQMSENKWHRFHKEFTIPPHSITNGIKAKLEGGLLYIRLPRNVTEVKPETKSPTPNFEADENQKQPRGTEETTTQEEPKTSEVSQTKEKGKVGKDDNISKAQEMHETIDGLSKDEKNVEQSLPVTLYGLVGEVVKQKKVANMLVLIFLLLGMGIYVKNAIKSTIQIG